MKMYGIPKYLLDKAFEKVKSRRGGAGVDGQTILEFEKELDNNLYKIWNRMSSGSYMPPAVKMVEIPKSDGKMRKLGIPTVSDRVAQMVVKMVLEPQLEPHFHPDSYGYRPGKSAHDALAKTRERCWRYNWVVDIDIKGFFDNIDHELVMKAVEKHTSIEWVRLYIRRWLQAPIKDTKGNLCERDKGTPQGGVISPLLANLFLHYAFDRWMQDNHERVPFARYADDIVVHCNTESQANTLKQAIEKRMHECKLELHPEKTKIVYCKSNGRNGGHPLTKFDFLGFEFKPRQSKSKHGKYFMGFLPAVSTKALKQMRKTIRSWRYLFLSGIELQKAAARVNPILEGWIRYYGKFYRSALSPLLAYLNKRIVRWTTRKYKRLKGSLAKGITWLIKVMSKQSELFVHWKLGFRGISEQ